MPVAIEPEVEAFIKKLAVARLATADAAGRPSVVPVCFVLVGGYFYTPIDEKRKRALREGARRGHREAPLPIPTVQKRPHRPETADQNQPRDGHALDCHWLAPV